MLKFVQEVAAGQREQYISVFEDTEKGHTIYMNDKGEMVVISSNKAKIATRAAGFTISAENECNSCDGC